VKYKVGHIFDEIYRTNIYFIPKANIPIIKDFVKIQFDSDYEESPRFDGRTLGFSNGKTIDYIIAMRDFNKGIVNLSSLTHECLHVSLFILDDHGVDYNGENSEQLNYHLQWLFRKCLECKDFKEYTI